MTNFEISIFHKIPADVVLRLLRLRPRFWPQLGVRSKRKIKIESDFLLQIPFFPREIVFTQVKYLKTIKKTTFRSQQLS